MPNAPSRAFASGYGYIVIFGSIAARTRSPAVSADGFADEFHTCWTSLPSSRRCFPQEV